MFGDDPDEQDDDDDDMMLVPIEDAWLEFTKYMGWTDFYQLGRQPHDYVHRCYTIYQIKAKYGKLTGSGMF